MTTETYEEWCARLMRETDGMTKPGEIVAHLAADYEKNGPPPAPPLTDFEVETLREAAGEIEARPWGAAVGQALEVLRGSGYLDGNTLTSKGAAFLQAHVAKP